MKNGCLGILCLSLLFLAGCQAGGSDFSAINRMETPNDNIREPAVAGQFYPADADRLEADIERYLAAVPAAGAAGEVKAVMAPHAGYMYSGPVAAYAYQALKGRRTGTAVLISNSHTAFFDGAAVDPCAGWRTPLGIVPVDRALAEKLIEAVPGMVYDRPVHAGDHTLEVQLPFLQTVLPAGFKILPILFGQMPDGYQALAEALAERLAAEDVIIVSTDMSHYPAYAEANRIDPVTLAAISANDIPALERHIDTVMAAGVRNEDTLICGTDGVKTAMALARRLGWSAEVLHYANSGDAAGGDKGRVVGYGAVAFREKQEAGAESYNEKAYIGSGADLGAAQKSALIGIAKDTVRTYVQDGRVMDFNITDERLNRREGAFVTLRKGGELRGCIGQIVPDSKPLWQVVRDMAVAACAKDPRFAPVRPGELPGLEYEVSVLSAPERIYDWRRIELGRHGVIVRGGLFKAGVFLPQVAAETGWSREEFLSRLCHEKAGLPRDCYLAKDTVIEVFTAQVFGDKDEQAPSQEHSRSVPDPAAVGG